MDNNNQWMMMTYYCPTHGSREKCEPIQITKNELIKAKKDHKSLDKSNS
tara:strand:- start:275 stop:421 length:147 start_codon:yes stop_codon:yes gene_type:complete